MGGETPLVKPIDQNASIPRKAVPDHLSALIKRIADQQLGRPCVSLRSHCQVKNIMRRLYYSCPDGVTPPKQLAIGFARVNVRSSHKAGPTEHLEIVT